MNLDKLLKAKSIVIVGANDKPGFGIGSAVNIPKGEGVKVYYLNPNRDELLGQKCFHSLDELPEVPDCMAMVVPKKIVCMYLEEGGKYGIKSAVVFASGFAEEGSVEGKELEEKAVELCKKYDIALCGPNCIGFQNYIDKICGSDMDPNFTEKSIEGGCGFVSQSGLITGGVIRALKGKLSYAVSAGNGPVCSVEDYLLYFAEDSRVNILASYIEGIRNAKTFEKALKTAVKNKKPIIILKSGKSTKGAKSAASHTGNMAGSYDVFYSICKRFGAIMTDSLEEFTATIKVFTVLNKKYPSKPGVAGINFSGGENTLFADLCEKYCISLPELENKTIEAMNKVVPEYCTPSNPLDATATMFRQEDKVEDLFRIFSEDENIGTIILGSDMSINEQIKEVISARVLSRLSGLGNLPTVLILPSYNQERSRELVEILEDANIPILPPGELSYKIINNVIDFSMRLKTKRMEKTPEISVPDEKLTGNYKTISEYYAEEILKEHGIAFPNQRLVKNSSELTGVFGALNKPLVMKIVSPDIAHKTEAGGVKVGISSLDEAEKAFEEIINSCRKYDSKVKIDGILVQEMLPIHEGIEFIAGIKSDPQFGPVMLIGLGGIFTEVFKDIALKPCPVTSEDVYEMLKSLKGYKLLTGYRGKKEMDIDALVNLVVKLSKYAESNKNNLLELDINPIVVLPKGRGALAADALITILQN